MYYLVTVYLSKLSLFLSASAWCILNVDQSVHAIYACSSSQLQFQSTSLKKLLNSSEGRKHGRRLREGLGEGPVRILCGGGPCIRPPNFLRSSVVGRVRKYELSKKGVIKEFVSEIEVFMVKMGP